MLHPIGRLPSQVYWWRRLLLVGIVLAISFAAGWFFVGGASGDSDGTAAGESTAATAEQPSDQQALPNLEQIVPSLVPAESADPGTSAGNDPAAATAVAEPAEPGPCPDEAIGLTVGSELGQYAAGSKPLLGLNITNIGTVACFRDLDRALQTWGLFAADGTRLWGSNDCYPEPSLPDAQLLQPAQVVTFTIIWSGQTSEPSCTADRQTLGPGSYILRGYLGTVLSPDVPLVLT
ncbi:MAG: MucR family transcriptional regulator [Actinomycetota bacterium]|nr:MucR family transcriptional regulator [Actinomycetota bacterium]